MENTLQSAVVEAWKNGTVEIYVQLHRAAVLAGDLTGAFLMSARLWGEVASSGEFLDRLFHQLKDWLSESGDSVSDHERRAWAAYHVGKVCLRVSNVEAGIRWLSSCLENSDGVEKLKLDCLLEMEEAYRGWNPEKVVEMSQQAVDVALRLGNVEHLVAALYRLAGGLETLGYMERRQKAVDDLRNLSEFFSSTNPAMHHFASTLYRVCQGESLREDDQHEAAYEEFTCGLTHLQFLPEFHNEIRKYLSFQKDGRGFWPPKCELAVEVGVHLSARLAYLRKKLGKEATDDEKSLDQYLEATKTRFKSVNTINLQHLRERLNDCLARNSLEDAESYGAELLKAAVTDEMAKYRTAAIDALQGLAIICYRYHAANFRGNETAFQIVDSFLKEAEELASSSEVTSYLKLRRDRAFYKVSYGGARDTGWKTVVQDDLHHILEMERRVGSVSDERIQLLQNAREFFDDIQCRYLEWSDPPQVEQALLWAERARSRDMLHHLAVENGNEFDMASFDMDDDWGWKELESVCCQHKTSVFLLFSIPGDDIYSYFLHADDEPQCVKVKSSGTGIKQCFKILHAILFRGGEETRRLRKGLLTLFYAILIQPWEETLERIKPTRLVILPTKELCSVPFSALRVPENNLDLSKQVHFNRDAVAGLCTGEEADEYLIEKYEIVVAPSLRMFNYCEKRRETLSRTRLRDAAGKQALLVINPTEDLAEAENEALEVESCLSSCGFEVKYLEKKEATRQAVGEALRNSHWAHFATHGYLDEKFRRGALVLAPEAGEPGLFEHVTGVRLVRETLNCAEVTVLSSYTSGIGLDNYPEGNLGLPRSFHMAGVPTCVASLWKVDDRSTRSLMECFYRSLMEGGCVSRAMQEAMKLMIHADEDEITGDPAYDVTDWAAFYVSGAASSVLST